VTSYFILNLKDEQFTQLKLYLDKLQVEKKKLTYEKGGLEAINKIYECELEKNKELKRQLKVKTEQKISESIAVLDIEKKSLESQFTKQIKEKEDLIVLMKNGITKK
jgi:hypothetical protein